MSLFAERKIYSVSQLTAEIRECLEGQFRDLLVSGELANFKHHSSGHMYFTLRDGDAQIRAACFRGKNRFLKFQPKDGLEVIVRGRVSVYEPRGDYQLLVESMEPVGVGSLQLAFQQLKERLKKEGLFEESRKKPLPVLPQKVGVVMSPTGAAIRDVLRILKRRNASLHVLLYPARSQGTGAAREIAEGIACFNRRRDIDVIILGRGGGSIEDLWAFNEERLARAIADSSIPVIAAVGHEVDYTIADFVADVRAPTPSAAAELVSAARDDLRDRVRSLGEGLLQAIRLVIEKERSRLRGLSHNRAFAVAPGKVRELQQRFDEAHARSIRAMRAHMAAMRQRQTLWHTRRSGVDLRRLLERKGEIAAHHGRELQRRIRDILGESRAAVRLLSGRMDALSPLAILGRGYAICRDGDGRIVRDAAGVSLWDRVEVELSRGSLRCQVDVIHPAADEGREPS